MKKGVEWFQECIRSQRYILTLHARQECNEEDISIEDIEHSILHGKIIEDYSSRSDVRGVSYLISGSRVDSMPLHVVVASSSEKMYVVTVYVPKPPKWIDEDTRRVK